MKTKKRIFPFMLMLAFILTASAFVSINKSFAVDIKDEAKEFNLYIDNTRTKGVDILQNDNTSITYILKLKEDRKEYNISFDITNDSIFDLKLANYYIDQIPDELKDILTYEITKEDKISANNKTNINIKYNLKDNLTKEEKDSLKDLKVNLLLNYIQE